MYIINKISIINLFIGIFSLIIVHNIQVQMSEFKYENFPVLTGFFFFFPIYLIFSTIGFSFKLILDNRLESKLTRTFIMTSLTIFFSQIFAFVYFNLFDSQGVNIDSNLEIALKLYLLIILLVFFAIYTLFLLILNNSDKFRPILDKKDESISFSFICFPSLFSIIGLIVFSKFGLSTILGLNFTSILDLIVIPFLFLFFYLTILQQYPITMILMILMVILSVCVICSKKPILRQENPI